MSLSKKYTSLVEEVVKALKVKISGREESKFLPAKALKVNIYDYVELVLWEGKLIFLDAHGLHYSLFVDCSLEDLMELMYKD